MPIDKLTAGIKQHIFVKPRKIKKELKNYSLVEINSLDANGESPLHVSLKTSNMVCFNELIAFGADINIVNKSGYSVLHTAMRLKSAEAVKSLLENKVNIDNTSEIFISSFIEMIGVDIHSVKPEILEINSHVRNKCFEIFKLLEPYISNIRFDKSHELLKVKHKERTLLVSLLSTLIYFGHQEFVEYLIINKIVSPIDAIEKNDSEIVISPLARVLMPDIWSNIYENIALLLINNGADITALNHEGVDPLLMACMCGSVKVVEALLARGSNIHISCITQINRIPRRVNVLHAAILGNCETRSKVARFESRLALVKYLINNGAKLDSEGDQYWPPLHHAISRRLFNIVELLIQSGADLGLDLSSKKISALQFALKERCAHSVQIILRHIRSRYSSEAEELQIQRIDQATGISAIQSAAIDIDLLVALTNSGAISPTSAQTIVRFSGEELSSKDYLHSKLDEMIELESKLRLEYAQNGVNTIIVMIALQIGVPFASVRERFQQYIKIKNPNFVTDNKLITDVGNIYISNTNLHHSFLEKTQLLSSLMRLYADWWINHAALFSNLQNIAERKVQFDRFLKDETISRLFDLYCNQSTSSQLDDRIASERVEDPANIETISKHLSMASLFIFAHKDNINLTLYSFINHLKAGSYTNTNEEQINDILFIISALQKIVTFNIKILDFASKYINSSSFIFVPLKEKIYNKSYAHFHDDLICLSDAIKCIQYDRNIDLNDFVEDEKLSLSKNDKSTKNPYLYRGMVLRRNKSNHHPTAFIHFSAVHLNPDVDISELDVKRDLENQRRTKDIIDGYQNKQKKSQQSSAVQKDRRKQVQIEFAAQRLNAEQQTLFFVKQLKLAQDQIDLQKFKHSRKLACQLRFQKIEYTDAKPNQQEIAQRLIRKEKLAAKFGLLDLPESYVIGGAVISLLSDYPIHDYDFVTNQTIDFAILLKADLKRMTMINVPGMKFYRSYTHNIDITAVQSTDECWLAIDSCKRDFTIAAVYCNKEGELFGTPQAINDITNKILRINGSVEDFYADPVRLLRAIKFMVAGFLPDEVLSSAISSWMPNLLNKNNQQEVSHFFIKFDEFVMKYGHSFLDGLSQFGLLEKLLVLRYQSINDQVMPPDNGIRFFTLPLPSVGEPADAVVLSLERGNK